MRRTRQEGIAPILSSLSSGGGYVDTKDGRIAQRRKEFYVVACATTRHQDFPLWPMEDMLLARRRVVNKADQSGLNVAAGIPWGDAVLPRFVPAALVEATAQQGSQALDIRLLLFIYCAALCLHLHLRWRLLLRIAHCCDMRKTNCEV